MHRKTDQPDLILSGRIDGLTAPAVRQSFDEATADGKSIILVDLSGVTYLSSAGLRVFLQVQKELKKAGGELILLSPTSCFSQVLRISGMDKFFTTVTQTNPAQHNEPSTGSSEDVCHMHEDGYSITLERYRTGNGILESMGNPELLPTASFGEKDVFHVPMGQFTWGTGIASSGNQYAEYRNLFGESVILAGHFLSFPSVSRPSVDYMLYHKESAEPVNFLYGFGFSGSFCALGGFEMEEQSADLSGLLSKVAGMLNLSSFGVVLVGRSEGIYGLHLRRSPASGPVTPGTTLFDPELFPGWFSFPAEADHFNTIVIATGLFSIRDPQRYSAADKLIPSGARSHLHAAVMERGLVNYNSRGLTEEVDRIVREFEPLKVVHLLPASRIKKGIIGIISF